MVLGDVFERFAQDSPLSVMAHGVRENAVRLRDEVEGGKSRGATELAVSDQHAGAVGQFWSKIDRWGFPVAA